MLATIEVNTTAPAPAQKANFHSIGRSKGQKTRFNSLDQAIYERAKADLDEHPSTAEFRTACLFFFLHSDERDGADPLTFEALCQRNGIDAGPAAEVLWNSLKPELRVQVMRYLCSNDATLDADRLFDCPEEGGESNDEEDGTDARYWGRRAAAVAATKNCSRMRPVSDSSIKNWANSNRIRSKYFDGPGTWRLFYLPDLAPCVKRNLPECADLPNCFLRSLRNVP